MARAPRRHPATAAAADLRTWVQRWPGAPLPAVQVVAAWLDRAARPAAPAKTGPAREIRPQAPGKPAGPSAHRGGRARSPPPRPRPGWPPSAPATGTTRSTGPAGTAPGPLPRSGLLAPIAFRRPVV